MARELDIRVVAEGVEKQEQRENLPASCSTTHAQGYYFSKPVDAALAE
jgi:EAL domain-containing protein (putative c-di-GMP-specific phosphodiesterase class I)